MVNDEFPLNRWVSVNEVANHLGIARDTVYRWIVRRELPAYRVGRLWKFRLSDIDEWVQNGESTLIQLRAARKAERQ